ncbi:hypothetical protein KUCAC02_008695, partial [Chaenocephalus aceratus]
GECKGTCNFRWERPSCATRDVSLTSSISRITCIRRVLEVRGTSLDQDQDHYAGQ